MTIPLLCCSGSLDGGGSERQLWQLATRISSATFCARIYLHYLRGVYLERCPQGMVLEAFWEAHQATGFCWPGAIHRAQVAHLAQTLRREQIQVVYDRTFHMTLVTAAACRAAGVPRVSVIVSPPSHDFGAAGERFAWLKKRRLRAAYADRNSLTLAVSQSVAADAAEFYGMDESVIDVVPSPIDIHAILELAGTDPLKQRRAGDLKVCVVGRLSDEKGQAFAIDAFAQLAAKNSASELEILGDGPDRAKLERRVAELGIEQQVNFRGFVDNPYPSIRSADLIVIPSKYEGLPNVAMEAMALGTPVVATNCSSAACELLGVEPDELAGAEMPVTGLRGEVVATESVGQLAEALLAFDPRSASWRQRATAAQRWITDHHSLEAWLERMEQLLVDAVHRHASGGRS